MPDFRIAICKPEYKQFYPEWQDAKKQNLSDEAERLGETGDLSKQVRVTATGMKEAINMVKEQNPDYIVMPRYCHKIG